MATNFKMAEKLVLDHKSESFELVSKMAAEKIKGA
jgi:hypothetical protein